VGLNSGVLNLAVALGVGLLIGAERERRKEEGPGRSAAGIRTFAVSSLAGAVSFMIGGSILLAVVLVGVTALLGIAYWRGNQEDPGLTTEIALVLTTLLGGLAIQEPALAGGLAVTITVLLAARSALHRLVRTVLTEDELTDGLIFAASTLVILPLVPNRPIGPYDSLNPHSIWILVILIMAISAAGYIAVRTVGARFGLPIAGLASGFISSTATIGSMGERAAESGDILPAAVAGAVLSTVATIIQMAIVLAATSVTALQRLSAALVCAGLAATVYGAVFTIRALRRHTDNRGQTGHAFSLWTALVFALILAAILVLAAALKDWFGETGVTLAAALGGFADTHAAAISVASLVATGRMRADDAVIPILAGLSTNTVSKLALAAGGGRSFALRVIPGLIIVVSAAWAGALLCDSQHAYGAAAHCWP